MADNNDPKEALAQLADARTRYDRTEAAYENAREQAIAAVVAALRAGAMPTEVVRASRFTDAYVRKIARDHGIAPARPGIKSKKTPARRSPAADLEPMDLEAATGPEQIAIPRKRARVPKP
ncbi:hypothetical protein ACWKSP_26205 [Micromonosporaceae bacterium Da 78-11]